MSLNIKNEDVHDLVRELADVLGTSQTSAVEVAVREKLAAVRADTKQAERERRIRRAVADLQEVVRGSDVNLWRVMDDLYDSETGLPR